MCGADGVFCSKTELNYNALLYVGGFNYVSRGIVHLPKVFFFVLSPKKINKSETRGQASNGMQEHYADR